MDNCTTKRCTKCGNEYPANYDNFAKLQSKKRAYLSSWCRECLRADQENRRRIAGSRKIGKVVIINDLRKCTKCEEWKPNTSEYFYKNKQCANGLSPCCKTCVSISSNNYRKTTKGIEVRRESDRRRRNTESYRAKVRKHRKTHNLNSLYSTIRRARKQSLPSNFTKKEWINCLNYWGGRCVYCGNQQGFLYDTEITADHFIPLALDNAQGTCAGNIIPACRSCNCSKKDKIPLDWLISKFGKRIAKKKIQEIEAYFKWVIDNQ